MVDGAVNNSHSWWWGSHASPKHSRWLKENLADMDLKVKDMLKLIEEDADSFAKRAEMYYKKRPELLSLVEEFYRTYRALAERYDHITGELHQVQCSVGDAFPNQLRNELDSFSPHASLLNKQNQDHAGKKLEGFGSVMEYRGHECVENKETAHASACLNETGKIDFNEITKLQKEISSLHQEKEKLKTECEKRVHEVRELEGFGSAMEDRGHECVENKETVNASACSKEIGEIDFNEITKLQKEISSLHQEKEKLKTECEKGVHEVRVVQEQLLQMQVELHHVQEENHKLIGNSSSYVAQISELQDQVSVLKRQNDAYVEEAKAVSQKLQSELQEKNKLIMEIQRLEVKLHELERRTEVKSECSTPDQGSNRKKFANLQDDLFKLHHENHNLRMQVMTGVQQLQKANEEIQKLHHSLLKSQAENDTMILQYQQSFKLYESAENRAKDLQIRMAFLQEENRRIIDEIAGAVLRMKITEGAHNLEREKSAFQQNIWHRIQRTDFLQGLRAKQDEVQNLGMGILDETQQIVNFDAVIRNYQQSLSQSQEQQNILSAELQAGNERLKDAEKRIKVLEEEIHNLHREKDNLKEESSSAVVSIKNLEQEVYKLKQEKSNLLNEVAFRLDQRDALQQELYCLKEDRNDLDRKYQTIMKQIESWGLDVASIQLVFASLQDIREKLREHRQIHEDENVTLLQVLQKMEELLKRIVILENLATSHQLQADKLEFEMKHLKHHIEDLQNEKAELLNETKHQYGRITNLEEKLEDANILYSQLQKESQQHEYELADALECMKHLNKQICSLQGEKEVLQNETVQSTLQMSYAQKQVDLLKEEVEDLKIKLEEEINKEQKSETEIKKLKQTMFEMDNRNQTLLDDYHTLDEKFGAVEEKVKKLEETTLKQQIENDMLLHNLSSAIEFNRELEPDIQKLQKLLGVSCNAEGKLDNAGAEATKMLKSIVVQVQNLQEELTHFQEENQNLRNDALAKKTHLEQLQRNIFVLSSEKESIKEEAAVGLENITSLQKENSQLQVTTDSLRINLEAWLEREGTLIVEIQSLQQSLKSSVSAHLALEGEYQRILEEHNSMKACHKESESKLLKTEEENQTLLIEALSQGSLVSLLESLIVEKVENMQIMNLEAGLEREGTLILEIQSLQQSLKSSVSAHLALEGEYERMLEEHNSMKACLKESESKLLKTEEENQTLLIEALSQGSLVSLLESLIVEKDENMQIMNLEAGLEREGTLILEIQSLQQSLKSSVSAHLALEGEYQRILEEHNSMKACLKESESKLLKTEEENQTLLIEVLSQGSLVSLLESLIVEKDENMQIMEEQLNSFQEKIAKVECWLQSGGSTPQLREAEIWQLQEFIGGFREEEQGIVQGTLDVVHGLDKKLDLQIQKGANQVRGRGENVGELCQEGTTLEMTEKEIQQEVPILTEEGLQLKCHVPVKYDIKISDILHDLQGEKQREDDKISCRSIQKRELHAMPMGTQAQGGKPRKLKAERCYESPKSSLSEKTYFEDEHWKNEDGDTLLTVASDVHGSDARSEVHDCKSQVPEPQILITDLQQENIELKCHRWKKNAIETIKGKEYPQDEEQNSKLRLVERHLDIHDDKDVLFDEERGGESIEENLRHDICCLQELNQKLWTRFDSATQQFSKLQINFQELQEKFWKTMLDNKKATADGQKGKQTNDTEKQLQELQDELLVWLECNDMLTKEAQNRFATAHRLQAELSAAKGGHSGDKCEETESASSQEEKLQNEVLSIQEESSKIADVLQAGSDQARGLKFEVEKILLKFQGERKILTIEQHKKAHIPRVRTSLRTFLFGKEEQRQKRRGAWICMHPVINE